MQEQEAWSLFRFLGSTTEKVIIVVECSRSSVDVISAAMAARVAEAFDVTVADVVALPFGTLPKTSSGKLQRSKVRDWYLHRQENVQLEGASLEAIERSRQQVD